MLHGLLVNPDLSRRVIEFELEHAQQLLGGATEGRVSVAFQEDGSTYAALYNHDAHAEGAEPNPLASLARNNADTGNSAFFTDPIRAIHGPVIFVDAQGEEDEETNNIEVIVAAVEHGVRAVKNYREDYPEEYQLWRAAAMNRNNEA